MPKLNTVGFIPPQDFPAKGHNNIHECINEYQGTHNAQDDLLKAQLRLFRLGWNGVAYRYRAMAEYDEEFTSSVKTFGNAPPPEERYRQGKTLFGFFANAVSVLDCFSFSTYCMASILKPDIFPVSEPRNLRFYPKDVEPRFAANFSNDPLSLSMSRCFSEPTFKDMCDIRDVLSHRGMPPRSFYAGGERNGMATMPINPKAPSDQWQFDFLVDERTTKMFREWLAKTLKVLIDSADKFYTSKLKT
jgi:hypothetical protein